jgi:1-phosphatidylinositol-3-phosphate 5-kinase
MDLASEIKQEDDLMNIIVKKIEQVNPDLIFVQDDCSTKAIEAMLRKEITVVSNVKESIMQRIGRLTQTLNCPSTNLISSDFSLGKCEMYSMENLAVKSLTRTVDSNDTTIIKLEGCLPFLGCTILLSGPDMNELRLVKHALKKMLRMSRQLILENEYYQFMRLAALPTSDRKTPFLHQKHLERQFLIFKKITFANRKFGDKYDGEEDDDPLRPEQNVAAVRSEREV